MPSTAKKVSAKDNKPGFLKRLFSSNKSSTSVKSKKRNIQSMGQDGKAHIKWSYNHIKIIEAIYGKGFFEAGGAMFGIELLKPLELKEGMNILDLTVSMGGTAMINALNYMAPIIALENKSYFFDYANGNITDARMEKLISLSEIDVDDFTLPENHFDVIYTRDRFHMIESKEDLLLAAAKALKFGGKLLVADILLAPKSIPGQEVSEWITAEMCAHNIWSVDHFQSEISDTDLKLVKIDDLSDDYLTALSINWHKCLSIFTKANLSNSDKETLINDAKATMLRMQLLQDKKTVYNRLIFEKQHPGSSEATPEE